MKPLPLGLTVCSMLFWASELNAAPFINLGFESANTSNATGTGGFYYASATEMTPGWFPNFTANIGITYSRTWPSTAPNRYPYLLVPKEFAQDVGFPLVGSFAFAVKSRDGSPEFSFAQVGDIPYGATELRFLFRGSVPIVRVAGTPDDVIIPYPGFDLRIGPALTLVRSEDFTTFDHYRQASYLSYDVSSYAGQTLELSFTGNTPSYSLTQGQADARYDLYIDDIRFVIVPEPSTKAMIAVSIASRLCWARFRARRKGS